MLNSRNLRSLCQNCKNLFADIFLGIITALFEISWNCNCNLEYLSYLGENEELTGTKVPHMKVTGTVTKFHLKSNFPIPVDDVVRRKNASSNAPLCLSSSPSVSNFSNVLQSSAPIPSRYAPWSLSVDIDLWVYPTSRNRLSEERSRPLLTSDGIELSRQKRLKADQRNDLQPIQRRPHMTAVGFQFVRRTLLEERIKQIICPWR